MISRLRGIIVERTPPHIVLDVQGVGYDVEVPMRTYCDLPERNDQTVTLLTHHVVREDAQLLYGFLTEEERATFRTVIKISGVGPKLALSLLSSLSVEELAQTVHRQETGRLQRVPGIGKKTAERLMLELKGKLGVVPTHTNTVPASDDRRDMLDALLALGYSESEAQAAMKQVPDDVNVAQGIKHALRYLTKS